MACAPAVLRSYRVQRFHTKCVDWVPPLTVHRDAQMQIRCRSEIADRRFLEIRNRSMHQNSVFTWFMCGVPLASAWLPLHEPIREANPKPSAPPAPLSIAEEASRDGRRWLQ